MFDGALAELNIEVRLAPGARYLGWDIMCFGRAGSGERYARGECKLHTALMRGDKPIWLENGQISAGGTLASSPAGLGDRTVCGTLIAACENIDGELLEVCRRIAATAGEVAVTHLPGVLVARYLGDSSEAAKQYFISVWAQLRPAIAGRTAIEPRIWRT